MSRWKTLQYRAELTGVKLVRGLVRLLPRRVAASFGALLGWKAYRVFRLRRGVALDNIERSLTFESGGDSADTIACASYINLGRSMMEFASLDRLDSAGIRALVGLEGGEWLDQALAAGRGAVLVTGHFGNWELAAAAVSAYGYPVSAVVASQANPLVDREINGIREAHLRGVVRRESGMRQVFRALDNNEFVAFVPDQDARHHGAFVDFLGRPASSHKGPAQIAVRRKAPVSAAYIHRVGGGRHVLAFSPLMRPDETLGEEEAVVDLMQRYTDSLAGAIRTHPTEYLWAHKRWKTPPP